MWLRNNPLIVVMKTKFYKLITIPSLMADEQLYQRTYLFHGPSLELKLNKHGKVKLPSSAVNVIENRGKCDPKCRDSVLVVTPKGDSYIYRVAGPQSENEDYAKNVREMLQKPEDNPERREFFSPSKIVAPMGDEVRISVGGRIPVPEAYKQETAVRYIPNGDCFMLEKIVAKNS